MEHFYEKENRFADMNSTIGIQRRMGEVSTGHVSV